MTALRGALAAVLAAAATGAFNPVFGGPWALLPLLGAVAVPTVVALVLGLHTRTPSSWRALAGLVGLGCYLALGIAPGAAVFDGAKRLLTTALPAAADGPELAFVAALAGLAGLAAVEAALRRRAALLPLLPVLLFVLTGLALGASAGPPPAWVSVVLALGAGWFLALAARPAPLPPDSVASAESSESSGHRAASRFRLSARPAGIATGWRGGVAATLRWGAAAGVVIALAAGAAVLAAPVLPGQGTRAPVDARALFAPPLAPKTAVSPLVRYPVYHSRPDRLLFTLRSSAQPERLRWVSLPRFDGTYWTTDATYRRAGTRLPAGPPLEAPVNTVEQDYRVADPDALGWLPSVGRPVALSAAGLGVDERSGDVLVPQGVETPRRYTLTGAVPDLDPAALRGGLPEPAREPPGLPPEVRTAAAVATGTQGTAFGQLAALETWFGERGGFRFDDRREPVSGHGWFQVRQLLTSKLGTAEQYASAFALMGRVLGYDTRVVLGFRPEPADRAGVYSVTSHDVDVWPEVRFSGLGWVAFDPVPVVRATGTPRTQPERPQSPVDEALNGAVDEGPSDAASQPGGVLPEDAAPEFPWWAAGVLAVVGLGSAYLVAVPVARGLRRRRRRGAPTPALRVGGAWRDAVDRLRGCGVRVDPTMTTSEVVAAADARLGRPAVAALPALAALADAAAFAPDGSGAPDPETAWRLAADLRRTTSASVPRLRRLRAWLAPPPRPARRPASPVASLAPSVG